MELQKQFQAWKKEKLIMCVFVHTKKQVEKHIIVPGEVPKLLKSESDTGSKTDIQYTIY